MSEGMGYVVVPLGCELANKKERKKVRDIPVFVPRLFKGDVVNLSNSELETNVVED